jgi:hypothetical protein
MLPIALFFCLTYMTKIMVRIFGQFFAKKEKINNY